MEAAAGQEAEVVTGLGGPFFLGAPLVERWLVVVVTIAPGLVVAAVLVGAGGRGGHDLLYMFFLCITLCCVLLHCFLLNVMHYQSCCVCFPVDFCSFCCWL